MAVLPGRAPTSASEAHRHEAELSRGGGVAAPGDEHRAEARDARVAGAPDLEGLQWMHRPTRAVVVTRTFVAHRRRERREDAAQLRARKPFEDVLLVRIAAEDARQVERERDPEQRHARAELALELDRDLPAVRAGRLEQRRRAGGANRVARSAAQKRTRPAGDD